MRTVLQQKKWNLFKKLQRVRNKEKKAELLKEFNSLIPVHEENAMYDAEMEMVIRRDRWLDENHYNEGDVMEDENGEYVMDVDEDGRKRRRYLLDELE